MKDTCTLGAGVNMLKQRKLNSNSVTELVLAGIPLIGQTIACAVSGGWLTHPSVGRSIHTECIYNMQYRNSDNILYYTYCTSSVSKFFL